MSRMLYTISVKKWWGWKSYRVHRHVAETVGDTAWWVLDLVDGSVLTIPDIGRKQVLVHPDFAAENERVQTERRTLEQQAQARANEIVRSHMAPPLPPNGHLMGKMVAPPPLPTVQ